MILMFLYKQWSWLIVVYDLLSINLQTNDTSTVEPRGDTSEKVQSAFLNGRIL